MAKGLDASEWKQAANKRRDSRHDKAGPETTGPARKKKTPSPKKRPDQIPIWELVDTSGRWLREVRYIYVTAKTETEAKVKAKTFGFPVVRALRLHLKEKPIYADLADTGQSITWGEQSERWRASLKKEL